MSDRYKKYILLVFIIGALVIGTIVIVNKTKSGFLFQVSPEKMVRCTGEFTGPPHGRFQYISDADRMNMVISQSINNRDKNMYTLGVPDNNEGITDKWII